MADALAIHRPDWVSEAVFYQIFPDRFARSAAASTDVDPWDAKPTRDNFLGGDLRGITERLDHLNDLGVNAVYLTPIFQAGTNHRYDTEDYLRIDPRLGDEGDLDRLVGAAHDRGIHIVLDAVFHHCGFGHWAFQDVVHRGADSAYADWFFAPEHPVVSEPVPNYATCSGCWYLPKLNVDNPDLRAHLFDAVRHWTSRGIDGWRLDVPYMMENPGFWTEFRGVVRAVNPDAYIVAEAWDGAGQWSTGETSDAAMNYPLRDALLTFFVDRRSGADRLADRLREIDLDVDAGARHHMLNLLASHDTARLRTRFGGERDLALLGLGLLLCLRGAPMLYYGDEVGMTGFNDPECRGGMLWDTSAWDDETYRRTRALVRVRRGSVALRRGDQVVNAVGENVVQVSRDHPGQAVTVFANRADVDEVVDVPQPGHDLLTGEQIAAGKLAVSRRGLVVVEHQGER